MRFRLLSICLLAAVQGFAQQAVPSAELDRSEILIGEPVKVTLRIAYRVDQGSSTVIGWPTIGDTLSSHVDVLSANAVDTVMPDKQNDPYLFEQRRTISITSWDSGYWAIPPFHFTVNDAPAETAPLLLTVNTVPVDTAAAYKDIQDIYDQPMTWKDWLREHWPWVAGGLGAAILLTILVRYLVRRARRPKAVVVVERPAVPLHTRTLEALRAIEARKLWQAGQVKQYQSEVTDVLRSYVEERFGVPALERTTDELMQALRLGPVPGEARERLGNMLRLADLVKFAKYSALPTENEQLMASAIHFIHETTSSTDGPQA